MFVIQIKDYENAISDTEPIISFDDTFYEDYKSVKDELTNIVLSYVDAYITDNESYKCDLIPNKYHDACIRNEYNLMMYEFVIMELVRKLPE